MLDTPAAAPLRAFSAMPRACCAFAAFCLAVAASSCRLADTSSSDPACCDEPCASDALPEAISPLALAT